MGEVECPYCNHKYEQDEYYAQDEKWEEECPKCEECFEAQVTWYPTIKTKKF